MKLHNITLVDVWEVTFIFNGSPLLFNLFGWTSISDSMLYVGILYTFSLSLALSCVAIFGREPILKIRISKEDEKK